MPSTLTWLDFSDAERRRALQVVELFAQSEARDELGLGTIRDAFADALFPGMSTVQRAARYFLFVPWIFREAEARASSSGADPLEWSRQQELHLIERLLAGDQRERVIGARARRRLQQLPSTIYWQGLARWGIRRTEGTREQWARSARAGAPAATNDDREVVSSGSWWHRKLVDPPPGWRSGNLTLTLRAPEADYLRERIRDRCRGTLLATLADRRTPWQRVDLPWHLDLRDDASAEQQRILEQARRFSEVMHGAALLYNLELARQSEDDGYEQDYSRRLSDWARVEAPHAIAGWSLDDLWEALGEIGSRHTPPAARFVRRWVALVNESPEAIGESATALALVRERELDVKGRRARISYEAARNTWRGAAGASQLDYRWASAQRQLLDIIEAEGH